MEKLPNKDIERMITFINHEAEEKVKELEIKAMQEYNNEKARLIKEETEQIERDFINKQKQIEGRKLREISFLKNKYKLMYITEKENIVQDIFNKALEKCRSETVSEDLIKSAVSKMNADYRVYCNPSDKKTIRNNLNNAEVHPLIKEAVGGLILVSKDGKTIVDNSFRTRADIIKTQNCSKITNMLFKNLKERDQTFIDQSSGKN